MISPLLLILRIRGSPISRTRSLSVPKGGTSNKRFDKSDDLQTMRFHLRSETLKHLLDQNATEAWFKDTKDQQRQRARGSARVPLHEPKSSSLHTHSLSISKTHPRFFSSSTIECTGKWKRPYLNSTFSLCRCT